MGGLSVASDSLLCHVAKEERGREGFVPNGVHRLSILASVNLCAQTAIDLLGGLRVVGRMGGLIPILLFLLSALPAQAQERPASFVDAATVVPGLVVEMRYVDDNNFVGRPIDGYEKPVCLLTRQAAQALADVARDLAPRGLTLKVFDCYRPKRAVAHFLRWAHAINDLKNKNAYYPDMEKSRLFTEGYIAARSGHSRGSTVDLTIVDANGELDMGTHFDFLSPRSNTSNPTVSVQAQKNRALLASAMSKRGFRPYGKEWWHFTLRGEPFPDTYFDFPVR
jgi:D-alanyl-D-alanine dipeptidase